MMWHGHLFVNRWLWGAVGLSTLLQVSVVNLPFLNFAFGVVPLRLDQWLLCVVIGSSVLWYSELRKYLARIRYASDAVDIAQRGPLSHRPRA